MKLRHIPTKLDQKMSSTVAMYQAISIPKYFLTLTGQWPVTSPTIFHSIMSQVSFAFAFFFSFSLAFECSKHLDDYQVLSEILSIGIPPTALVFKLAVFKMKSGYLLEVIEHLDWEEFNSHSAEANERLWEAVRFTRYLGSSYQVTAFMVSFLYSIMPLMSDKDLPIVYSYEADWMFFVVYVFQVVGLFYAVASNTCIDVLAVSLMGIASAQIDILNFNISNLKLVSIDSENDGIEGNNSEFNACVKHHNRIIRFVESLDNVFSLTILIQYMTSAACICNVGFQLVHTPSDDIIQMVKMFVFFIAMMCQLFLYCWYGNEITVKSTAIRDACYESQWYDSELKTRRSLLTIMERTKRPLFLTSGQFYVVSLQSFTSVIQTSYSYFALMQTLMEEEE